jgi:hypothetical protein
MGNINAHIFKPPRATEVPSWSTAIADTNRKSTRFSPEHAAQIYIAYAQQPTDRVILFSHGNSEDLRTVSLFARELASRTRSHVLCYDYCGYGGNLGCAKDRDQTSLTISSSCTTTEECCYACANLAMRWIAAHLKSHRVFVYGRSLGSGPTLWLAENYRVAGIILQAPFLSINDVAAHHLPLAKLVRPFIFNRFPNESRAVRLKDRYPALILHGLDDRVVPVEHGRRLAELLSAELWSVRGDHNDLEDIYGEKFFQVITDWLDRRGK